MAEDYFLLPDDLRDAVRQRRFHSEDEWDAQARAAVMDYILVRHPRARSAFLTGSVVTGDGHITSDVDVYILYDQIVAPVTEQLIHRGVPIQAIIASPHGLMLKIERDAGVGELALLPAFSVAEPIAGDYELVLSLRAKAQLALSAGPPEPRPEQIRRARAKVISNYVKLYRETGPVERYQSCTKLVASLSKYLQLCAGTWMSPEVRYEPYLGSAAEFAEVVNALPDALRGQSGPLKSAIHRCLMARDHVLWESFEFGPMPL